MKTGSLVVCAAIMLAGRGGVGAEAPWTGRISLSGAWALYPMVVRWAEEFKKVNPGVEFDVSAGGAGKGMTDALAGAVDLGMVSREINPAEAEKGAYGVAVVKDAVIPMINVRNPVLDALRKQGVKREVFEGIWIRQDVTAWNAVAGGEVNAPVRVYTRSDACGAAETWAKYLGKKQEDLKGIGVYGDPGLAEAVRKDPVGIGFNNVNFAYDAKTGRPVDQLTPVPLDINGNGVLDAEENFYDTRTFLLAAIRDGRFPSPPARNLYLVSQGKPASPLVREFIRWTLVEGQRFVDEAGYIQLPEPLLAEELKRLAE